MNSQSTPRPFPIRSIQGNNNNNNNNNNNSNNNGAQASRNRQSVSQPPAPPVDDEYGGIPSEDREHIDEVFDLMDMKKKGYLNSYEFRHSLTALGFDLSKQEYFHELEAYGTVPPDWPDSQSCPVNRLHMYIDNFRLCASKLVAGRDPRVEAAKVFKMFDYDGDGIISIDDMRQLAQDIREDRTLSDDEIQSMIDHLDHDGKGGVNLDEFIQMMEEAG